MKYRAIATDYDGTLATDGSVETETRVALERYREAGGRLLLVTGRELSDLQSVFSDVALFDGVVAENDRELLLNCGLAVAVDNAVPELKAIAHHHTKASRGKGVQELIDWCLVELND